MVLQIGLTSLHLFPLDRIVQENYYIKTHVKIRFAFEKECLFPISRERFDLSFWEELSRLSPAKVWSNVSVKSKLQHPPLPPGIPRAFDVYFLPGRREFD